MSLLLVRTQQILCMHYQKRSQHYMEEKNDIFKMWRFKSFLRIFIVIYCDFFLRHFIAVYICITRVIRNSCSNYEKLQRFMYKVTTNLILKASTDNKPFHNTVYFPTVSVCYIWTASFQVGPRFFCNFFFSCLF